MSKQASGNNSGAKTLNGSKQFMSSKENITQTPEQRILMLENNLNRVCLQQDALMPLLQMIEYIPYIQKTDALSKQILKRLDDHELRLNQNEKTFDKKNNSYSSSTLSTPGDTKGLKRIEKSIGSLSDKICDLESQVTKVNFIYETKLKEESSKLLRVVEQNSSPDTKEEIANLKAEFQQEFRNLYREINGLRNDIEFITNEEKKKKMQKKIQETGNQMNNEERVYVINFMEQEQFIDDLEYYEKENSFRLNYELDYMNMQIDRMNDQETIKNEHPFVMEKIVNLKYQIAATKKKYMNELRKIDQKFMVMEQLSKEQSHKLGVKGNQCLSQSENLQQKVGRIVDKIHLNIEQLTQKLGQSEVKMNQLK